MVLGSPESTVIFLYSVPIITFILFQGDFQQFEKQILGPAHSDMCAQLPLTWTGAPCGHLRDEFGLWRLVSAAST